jgi:hypothetical protein
MGFPNSYEFLPPHELQTPMGYTKMNFRSIGNAVCPPLIAALAGSRWQRLQLGHQHLFPGVAFCVRNIDVGSLELGCGVFVLRTFHVEEGQQIIESQ